MAEEKNTEATRCNKKRGVMLAYGLTQLGTSIVSAISLAAIAVGVCSVKQEAKVFTECVEEFQTNGKTTGAAVRLCNGG